jgi:hypothetical protein
MDTDERVAQHHLTCVCARADRIDYRRHLKETQP